MRLRVLFSVLISVFILVLVYYLVDLQLVVGYYAQNLRSSLFTAFLTVGSFLLSLKIFMVVKLKENIFDTVAYKERIKKQRTLNPQLTLYGPVKRLSNLLFWSISSAIGASVSQLTVGLIPHWSAAFFCIFMAVFAVSMLVSTLLLIKGILDKWLDYLEEENNRQA